MDPVPNLVCGHCEEHIRDDGRIVVYVRGQVFHAEKNECRKAATEYLKETRPPTTPQPYGRLRRVK